VNPDGTATPPDRTGKPAPPLSRLLGHTGINIMTRLMGLILAALAVEIMAEVDRKTDDGAPYSGSFQFSGFSSPETGCLIGDTTKSWNLQGGATNCGAATLL
jgi:hypothetical protein